MVKVNLKKEEILILVLDFLKNNGYVKSLHALEQESDVTIESLGRELAFLRTLILDGQWEDIEAFIHPLMDKPDFEAKRILFYIRKQKFEELLYDQNLNPAVVELVDNLKDLEDQCSKEEFHTLCYCVTLGKLTEHPAYRNWTPFKGRLHCFESIRPFFDDIYPMEGLKDDVKKMAPNRLLFLLKQSILYQLAHVEARAPEKAQELPNPVYLSLLHDLVGDVPVSGNPNEDPRALDKNDMLLAAAFLDQANEKDVNFVARADRVNPADAAQFYQSLSIGARQQDHAHPLRGPASAIGSAVDNLALGAEASNMKVEDDGVHPLNEDKAPDGSHPGSSAPGAQDTDHLLNDGGAAASKSEHETDEQIKMSSSTLRDSRVAALRASGQQGGSSSDSGNGSHAGSRSSSARSHGSRSIAVSEKLAASHGSDTSLRESAPLQSPQGSVSAMTSGPQHVETDAVPVVLAYQYFHPSQLRPTGVVTDTQVVRTVSFTPNGDQFAVGANSKTLRICNTFPHGDHQREYTPGSHMQVFHQRDKHHMGSIYASAWNSSGLVLATASNDRTIKLIHFAPNRICDTKLDLTLTGHTGTVRSLAFNPAGAFHQLVSAGNGDKNVRIWDASTGQCIASMTHGLSSSSGDQICVNSVALSRDGSLVLTGGSDCATRVWDFRTRECVRILTGTSSVSSVHAHPTGKYCAVGYTEGEALIWDLSQGCSIFSHQTHVGDCHAVQFSPDGQWLLTGGYDSRLTVTNTQDYADVTILSGHSDKVTACAWHPTRPYILSSSVDKTARLWQST